MDLKRIVNKGTIDTAPYNYVSVTGNEHSCVNLSANECAFGTSKSVRESLKNLAGSIYKYPDPASSDLINFLADYHKCRANMITTGNGADAVITNLAMSLIEDRDEVIIPEVTFPRYKTVSKIMRAVVVTSPMDKLGIDLDNIHGKITGKTKLIFLCNPNNPTGMTFDTGKFFKFMDNVPDNVVVVLDEAYIDFTEKRFDPDSINLLIDKHDNLFIIRTLSKSHGLAGVRIGYGIGDAGLVAHINALKQPYEVSLIAQQSALQALKDEKFHEEIINSTRTEKQYLYKKLDDMNIKYEYSQTNFILIHLPIESRTACGFFSEEGILVKPCCDYNLPRSIRVTVGTRGQNGKFVDRLGTLVKPDDSKSAATG